MADPLSVAATILPESSFDPVQFAKERRQDILKQASEKRERYNEAWGSVASPTDINRNVFADLIKKRNELIESGATQLAEGVDITDITNPKFGMEAMKFKQSLEALNMEAAKTINLDKYLGEVRNIISKDDKGVVNRKATEANIRKIQSARNMQEIDDFLSSKGDNIIETNRIPMNVNKFVSDNLKAYGLETLETSEEKRVGGEVVTKKFNELDSGKLKNAMSAMYNSNPELQEQIKYERENDPTDLTGGSDVDYFMERYGNPRLRQQTFEGRKPYEPKESKQEEKKYTVSTSPVETMVGGYKAVGRNVVAYDQSETINITPGEGIISLKTGGVDSRGTAVKFTPINSADYYILNKSKSGFKKGTVLTDNDIKRGTRFTSDDYEVKRMVEGTYPIQTKDKDGKVTTITKTGLVPYGNIQNEMDVAYKPGSDIPKTSVKESRRKDPKTGKIYVYDADTHEYLRSE